MLKELLFLSYLKELYQGQLRTSDAFALVKKDRTYTILTILFTELYLSSCFKLEILLIRMEWVAFLFMEENLRMKDSGYPTQLLDCFQWLMQAKIQIIPNFLLLSVKLLGLMESMLYLEELSKGSVFVEKLKELKEELKIFL